MNGFAGAFGDKRRAAAMTRLFDEIVEQNSLVIRKVGINRRGELAAHRVLSCQQVTPEETVRCLTHQTAEAVAGRRVVVAQDTTEINFSGRQSRGLGPAGNRDPTCKPTPGFLIHAAVAVDADEDTVLGLVEAEIWTREAAPPADRHTRPLNDKESQRWLRVAQTAGKQLAAASEIIVVGDRESDIYALFSRRPDNVQLLVRAAQNRALSDGPTLFAAADSWPVLSTYTVKVPPRRVGDAGRDATVVVRAGRVSLRQPRNAVREGDPAAVEMTLVDAREIDPRPGVEPLHWRLLSTLPAQTSGEAEEIVRLYRLRWRIEQTFRMLKTHGLCLEEVQTVEPHRLFNLAALAAGAAVRIIQLVDARDGSSRPASDVATPGQMAAAAALCPSLEGKTERQRNPHAAGSLAWLSWVVARLGGWNCYYKPPGPKTMRDGWQRFAAIAEGFTLAWQAQNV
jgi:hypothetical protein